jgi:hypothetical protein
VGTRERSIIAFGLLLAGALFAPAGSFAQQQADSPAELTHRWYVQGGAYMHYDEEDDYEGPPVFGGVEYLLSPKNHIGLSLFQNSFGQFSQYLYFGRLFHPWESRPNLHIKLTGGIVYGYHEPNHSTLPIRWGDAWGAGVVPSIGYRKDRWGVDVALLKESGLLFLAGWHF